MAAQDMGVKNFLMFIPKDGWRRIPIHKKNPVKYAQSKGAVTVKQRHSATKETIIWNVKKGMLV